MRIDVPGPPVSLEDIRAVEARLRVSLPASYVAFLRKHNGGMPEPSFYVGAHGREANISRLFHLEKLEKERSRLSIPIEDYWLPIGDTGGGDIFLLRLPTDAVFLWEHEVDWDLEHQPPYYLEPDIWELLKHIEGEEEPIDEIYAVATSGSMERVDEYLRENPIDRRNDICYALVHEAARAGNLDLVKYCVQKRASREGLMCAGACSENRQMIDYLLDELGLDINERDEKGRTPLFFVILDEDIRKYLVSRGARE